MIQHHLVYHFTSLEDNNTYYEANPQAAYYLVRSGKILHLVEDRLGKYAARVMETILFLGHATVNHLESVPQLRSLNTPVPNGITNGNEDPQNNEMDVDGQTHEINGDHAPETKQAPLHATLRALASHGYLMKVRKAHFQSPSDNFLEAQRTAASKPANKALKGKKQQEAIALDTDGLLKDWTHADLSADLMINGLPRGIKRKFGQAVSSSTDESRLVNGVNGNGNHAEKDEAENDWSEDEEEFDSIPMNVSDYTQY